ncbi:LacI family DNA-binding transcriptional regulator [Heyndrickxia coagulans]|uniref:LacI family DNA-binding transcriptional regulator n=1 Tax=Heyndrickxia coagulans TaxID=1398 RepID=UPI00105C2197|nr:LacI family DNA-binding transcriptional regulator [Heyndrickxia coagulans]MBF8418754.1 LacI family DNA-binding transcriptional regulator [Heyndrickxia coagulans]
MATMADIAKMAGVSIATVSRVLNYDDKVVASDETRRKIFEAAESLNYTKHINKKTARREKIAIVQWSSQEEELNDIYYMSIRLGAEKYAQEHGLSISRVYAEYEKIPGDVEGILAIGKFSKQQIQVLQSFQKPICFVDTYYEVGSADQVMVDFEQAVKDVIDYFVQQGHQRIGYIGSLAEDEMNSGIDPRSLEYTRYMQKLGLYRKEDVFDFKGKYDVRAGYQQMISAIRNRGDHLPTAFFIANDPMAIGSLKALHENNIRVPEQVSLIGFNDVSVSQYTVPALSTVKVYTEVMGEEGVALLLERINSREIPKKVRLGTKLAIRESSK